MRGAIRRWGAGLAVCALAAGCSSNSGLVPDAAQLAGRTPATSHAGSGSVGSHRLSASRPTALPRGGRQIVGHFRVVAYYGAAGAPVLGVLGQGAPATQAAAVIRRSRSYAKYGLPVLPAMELIATVAQAAPGPHGTYSKPVPLHTIRTYLAVAHRDRMLLILDLQPGRSTFLAQAKALGSMLLDPSVSLALDPEWKVTSRQRPGNGLIGSSRASDINATARWLSHLVTSHHLPDKLLAVHEFTRSMLPDRQAIRRQPGVEVTFHADGFGTQRAKIAVYHQLAFPAHPFGAGFKLFLVHDRRLMSPAQVMALRPRPDMITYQ